MPFRDGVKRARRKIKSVFRHQDEEMVTRTGSPKPTTQPPSQAPAVLSDNPSLKYPSHGSPEHAVDGIDLWNQAYENLRVEEEGLILDYEDKLSSDLVTRPGLAGGPEISKRELMETILGYKMDEVNRDTWKLKFGSNEVQVKDLVEPVLGVIDWANEYITGAVEANPYASVAWAGVSLLLPLLLNPSSQAESLAKGLDYISSLIVQGRMREELYSRRYESNGDSDDFPASVSHLASSKFQATSYCYYAKNSAFRLGLDVIKWNDWESMLVEIKERERVFSSIADVWRDAVYNDEFAAAETRHQEIMRRWGSVRKDVSGLRKAIEEAQMEEKRLELLSWLCSLDPSENHNAALDRHEDGTSVWLVEESREFEIWKQAPGSLLWLHGKAGSGKTILSSSVIKHLRKKHASDPETTLAYFYFSFSDSRKQNVIEMLASLLKQIVSQRPNIPQPFKDLGVFKEKGERPDSKTLEDIIMTSVRGFSACPALNGERRKLLNSIRCIVEAAPDNLHIFCTSRNEADINTAMSPLLPTPSRAAIDLTAHRDVVDHDIRLFIDSTLSSFDYNSWPAGIKEEYVYYQLETLRDLSSPALIRTALQDLPVGLDATYDRVLMSIDPKFQPQVLTLEQLAEVFIIRPGRTPAYDHNERLFEPEDVLKYLPGLVYVGSHAVDSNSVASVDSYSWYSPSVDKYVRLIHFSVKEYLISSRIAQSAVASHFSLSEEYAHQYIARSCVEWLLQYENESMAQDLEPPFHHGDRQYASDLNVHNYALAHWMWHLEAVPRESWSTDIAYAAGYLLGCRSWFVDYFNVAVQFMGSYHKLYSLSFLLMMWLRPYLHTTRLGLSQLTEWLTSGDPEVNEYVTQEDLDVTLQVASYGGDVTAIQSLLDSGANPDAKGVTMLGPAMRAAACAGNLAAVRHLLKNGADINQSSGEGCESPLRTAAASQQLEIVQLLVDRGADITLSTSGEKCALTSALSFGGDQIRNWDLAYLSWELSFQCLQILLKKIASKQSGDYGYPLQAACLDSGQASHFAVTVLLDAGANVNSLGGRYGTALQAACCEVEASGVNRIRHSYRPMPDVPGRALKCVETLIDHGADVNTQGGEYGTALQAECYHHAHEITLDKQADVNIKGCKYGTALQAVCRKGSIDTAQLLLDHGAEVNTKSGKYGTALHAAASCDRRGADMLRSLLDNGAEVNENCGKFGTALQAACHSGSLENVRFLLEHGADVNTTGGLYGTALQCACFEQNLDIVQLLLDHRVDVYIEGGVFGSAWHAVTSRVFESQSDSNSSSDITGNITDRDDDHMILRLLLEHSVGVNDTRGLHGTALQATSFWKVGNTEIASRTQFLISRGADANIFAGKYGLPLQSACVFDDDDPRAMGEYDTYKNRAGFQALFLLQNCPDLNVNARGGMYCTALQAAVYSGLETVVKILVLKKKADVNIRGGEYGSAINAAVFRGYWHLFKILLKAGAVPDSRRRVPEPDLDWLARIKEKHGRGAEERYWKVWEKFKDEEN
ncbi:ankyrin repeat-containing domain protein [Podospora appendiculata]|uniref:Ankyrin repeat-containing domain protein n=1 Tax=Podospora appendiculata TaxID=314037 RepID=A0AAE1CDB1_9PEZI|nr:ankyrin repeat-containing domain protein [Podospora appendiculata]